MDVSIVNIVQKDDFDPSITYDYWVVRTSDPEFAKAVRKAGFRLFRTEDYFKTEADAQAAIDAAPKIIAKWAAEDAEYKALMAGGVLTSTTHHGDGRYTDHYSNGVSIDREEQW